MEFDEVMKVIYTEIDTHIQSTDIIKDILCQGGFEGYIGVMLE